MEKNNQLWMGITVVVVIIAIAFIWWYYAQENSTSNEETNSQTTNTQVTTEPDSVQDATEGASQAISLSYAEALKKYADRRIQLDTSCQAHPSNVTYKDNTGIMIDNRSPQTRTVKVGTTFTIKPWSFKIVVLPDVYLKSKTLFVNCDQSNNVATILVQE